MILIDSDVAIDLLRRLAPAQDWFNQLRDTPVAISGFSTMELVDGCRDSREIGLLETFLDDFQIVWTDADALAHAYQIHKSIHLKNAIGILDVMIAQTAISLNAVWYTFNVKHYQVIPGLVTHQPYAH